MRKQNGFTLLEVLIVVVIAVSVAAFSVPAYKKTQEKNKYLYAQGVLLDLGTAVTALRADLSSQNAGVFPSSTTPYLLAYTCQSAVGNSLSKEFNAQDDATRCKSLFSRNYIQPVGYDSPYSGNKVKGFSFYICPQNAATSSQCCGNDSAVVACMYNNSMGSSSATAGQYWGAAFLEDGTIKRLTK